MKEQIQSLTDMILNKAISPCSCPIPRPVHAIASDLQYFHDYQSNLNYENDISSSTS